jgi:hypothetical protein
METTITGILYLDMLQQFLIPQLDEDDQDGRIYFQQDGAPPRYLGEVHKYLSTLFLGRWVGRAAPIARPLYSQDLMALDFSYGNFLKSSVHTTLACKCC